MTEKNVNEECDTYPDCPAGNMAEVLDQIDERTKNMDEVLTKSAVANTQILQIFKQLENNQEAHKDLFTRMRIVEVEVVKRPTLKEIRANVATIVSIVGLIILLLGFVVTGQRGSSEDGKIASLIEKHMEAEEEFRAELIEIMQGMKK